MSRQHLLRLTALSLTQLRLSGDPIQITVATTLNGLLWILGNTEEHTVSLSPPFVIPDQTAPSTAIIASGSSTVALVVETGGYLLYN